VGPAALELAFLHSGFVQADDNDAWIIGGIRFKILDGDEGTEIAPGLGEGDIVTVEFDVVLGATP